MGGHVRAVEPGSAAWPPSNASHYGKSRHSGTCKMRLKLQPRFVATWKPVSFFLQTRVANLFSAFPSWIKRHLPTEVTSCVWLNLLPFFSSPIPHKHFYDCLPNKWLSQVIIAKFASGRSYAETVKRDKRGYLWRKGNGKLNRMSFNYDLWACLNFSFS